MCGGILSFQVYFLSKCFLVVGYFLFFLFCCGWLFPPGFSYCLGSSIISLLAKNDNGAVEVIFLMVVFFISVRVPW